MVLSARLHTLCAHGVLERHRYQRQPDRYEYLLTAKGRALWPALHALARWGDTYGAAGEPSRIFEHASCQARVDTDLRCTRAGGPSTSPRPGPAVHPDGSRPTTRTR